MERTLFCPTGGRSTFSFSLTHFMNFIRPNAGSPYSFFVTNELRFLLMEVALETYSFSVNNELCFVLMEVAQLTEFSP